MTLTPNQDPHGAQSVLIEGHDLKDANGVVILLHGRGSPAANIIRLSQSLAPGANRRSPGWPRRPTTTRGIRIGSWFQSSRTSRTSARP
jgi:hypothetical protein